MKVSIHSFIDVITNSSTEIYVRPQKNAIGAMKDLVDKLLKASGSDKSADELFEFKLIPPESYKEVWMDDFMCDVNPEASEKEAEAQYYKDINDSDFNIDEVEDVYGDISILLTPKDGKEAPIDFIEEWNKVFSSEEIYG